jgi:hypothetical protein
LDETCKYHERRISRFVYNWGKGTYIYCHT